MLEMYIVVLTFPLYRKLSVYVLECLKQNDFLPFLLAG